MEKKKIIYLGLIFLLVVTSIVTCFSYAFLTRVDEQHGKINIVAGTLNYELSSTDLNNNQVVVEPGMMTITVTLKSLNDINSKYQIYYIALDGVKVGYVDVNLTSGVINANDEIVVPLKIHNSTSTNQIVIFGVEGGLINNDLSLKNGELAITEKIRSELLKDMILDDNTLITTTPNLTTTSYMAGDPNGLYSMDVTDGFGGMDGTTYFFRGNVTNNYVDFAGFTWKIIRINEDGTIRLILNGNTDGERYAFRKKNGYNEKGNYTYMYYSNSTIKTDVETWYNANITGLNALKVATGNYFCEAAKAKHNAAYTSGNATMVAYGSYIPDLKCVTDGNSKGLLNINVGLLNYDELILAGAYMGNNRSIHYLNDETYYWTMSPAGYNSSYGYIWHVSSSYFIGDAYHSYTAIIRPVINLKADTKATIDESTGHYVVKD